MSLTRKIILAGLLLSGWAHASTVDVNLNDDVVRVQGTFPAWGNLTADVGVLHHRDDGDVVHAGLLLVDEADATGDMVAGLGGRLISVDAATVSGQAVGVGGFFRYTFPQYNRLGISGHLYFAPDVLAFGDVSQYTEVAFRVQYNLLRQGHVYLGFRNVNADFGVFGDATVDTSAHLGLRIEF